MEKTPRQLREKTEAQVSKRGIRVEARTAKERRATLPSARSRRPSAWNQLALPHLV